MPGTPYHKLDRTVAQFRVINLLPGEDDEDIECVLKCDSLDTPAEYEALSYERGEHGRTSESIVLDGLYTKVTRNLKMALFYLRQSSTPRVLWIDALCIDQEDAEERSHQVSLMARIYSSAVRVICWLGLDHRNIIQTFDGVHAGAISKMRTLEPTVGRGHTRTG